MTVTPGCYVLVVSEHSQPRVMVAGIEQMSQHMGRGHPRHGYAAVVRQPVKFLRGGTCAHQLGLRLTAYMPGIGRNPSRVES